jgi:hypothetical protein
MAGVEANKQERLRLTPMPIRALGADVLCRSQVWQRELHSIEVCKYFTPKPLRYA